MSKQEMRQELAALSFSQKVDILEKLRDRSLAFAAAGPRSEHSVKPISAVREFCSCVDWEPCGCGNQPPYHCMWCCHDLSQEQIVIARKRGFYSEEKKK